MRIAMTAAFGLLLAAFVSLGFWQLDRAAEKRALFTQFAAGETSVGALSAESALPEHRYRRLKLSGQYLSSKQVLLDAMTHAGRVGYQVLTPFRPDDGDAWVIVNRGWIPAPLDPDGLPSTEIDESRRAIAGRIDALPRPGLKLETRTGPETKWPRILLYPSMPELAAEFELNLAQYQLLLDADQTDGFERAWQPRSMPPERHLGYAVQWFGLAATLVTIAVVLSIRALQTRQSGGNVDS
jgi:surfeit locus 1 family protein